MPRRSKETRFDACNILQRFVLWRKRGWRALAYTSCNTLHMHTLHALCVTVFRKTSPSIRILKGGPANQTNTLRQKPPGLVQPNLGAGADTSRTRLCMLWPSLATVWRVAELNFSKGFKRNVLLAHRCKIHWGDMSI